MVKITERLGAEALQALQNNVQDALQQRSARHGEMALRTDVDTGGWYQLAMQHAAEIVALEFKLARGE